MQPYKCKMQISNSGKNIINTNPQSGKQRFQPQLPRKWFQIAKENPISAEIQPSLQKKNNNKKNNPVWLFQGGITRYLDKNGQNSRGARKGISELTP